LLSDDGILYYNATRLENGAKTARFLTILYYPPDSTTVPSGAKARAAPTSR